MNKLVIYMSPVAPYQKIYIIKDGQMIDKMGVQTVDLIGIVLDAMKEYSINEIDFSGAIGYARAFGQKIHEEAAGAAINYINDKGEMIKDE